MAIGGRLADALPHHFGEIACAALDSALIMSRRTRRLDTASCRRHSSLVFDSRGTHWES